MNNLIIIQRFDHCLGNFINITPAIQMLYEYLGHPIKCKFETNWLKGLYKNWNCIDIVEKVDDDYQVMDTAEVSRHKNKDKSDWLFLLDLAFDKFIASNYSVDYGKYHTYVPVNNIVDLYEEACSIVHGCADDSIHMANKTISQDIYLSIISRIRILLLKFDFYAIGSLSDYNLRFKEIINYNIDKMNLRFGCDINDAINTIANSDFVIANDSGLMHVATALKIPCFAIWKNTPWKRQEPISKTTVRCKDVNVNLYIKRFLNDYKDQSKLFALHDELEVKYK